ncbi:uncharacterized protein LOC110033616 [Phalaenopsis equestris]|uniref:uncharacterized protein LOC110033616 n=1 Tax=Phalaenopsis equestris TaxID=78828 RepID=UPI0009E5A3EE|nr:uncharacterized protein LOC110033616 [Phalaenopsis equestris]
MVFFSWRILNDLIPTDDILNLKGLKVPSRCHLCKNNQESSDHLFFRCNFAREVWNQLISNSNLNLLNVGWGNLKDSLRDWQEINLMPLPFIVAWFIWNARNKLKHEDSVSPFSFVAANCRAYLHKLINWKKFPQILKVMNKIDTQNPMVIKVRREKPPYPFIKINTDGSFTNKKAGIGGIFRDHTSKALLYFKAPYITEDALETEAAGLYWALKIAKDVKWLCFIAKVDSSHLVELITDTSSSPWHINQWIYRIKKIITEIKFQIKFNYREANRPANFLALEGSNLSHAVVSTIIPLPLQLLTQGDKLQIPYLRIQN